MESMFDRIELSDPAANENDITPDIIMKIRKIYSTSLYPEMSPKPTVVMVVIVK